MASVGAALQLIQAHLAKTGWFTSVSIGEPDGPPTSGAAAVFLTGGSAASLSDTSFQRRRDITVRIYIDVSTEPREKAETNLDTMVYDTETALSGDLSLGSSDWVIAPGIEITETFDYVDMGGRPFRTADLVLPLSYRA